VVGVIIMGVVVGVEQLKAFPQRRGLTVKIKPIPTSLWESRRPIPTYLWLSVRPLPTLASVLFTLRASEAPRSHCAHRWCRRCVGGGRHRGGSGDGGIERNKRPEPKAALVFEGTKQFAPSARRAPVGRSGALW
jgi:hypothetical protein